MDDATAPWTAHRRRAEQLRERYPFAAELLMLYSGLLDVWASSPTPGVSPDELPEWAVSQMLPRVAKVTEASGPAVLADAVHASHGLTDDFAAWLAGQEVGPVPAYLARACLRPALMAAENDPCPQDPAPRGGRNCPRCGGVPQLSIRIAGGDALVSGARRLSCARCAHEWNFSASTCPGCGETSGAKRTLYAERRSGTVVGPSADAEIGGGVLPHVRVEACATCRRYLLDIDLGREPAAVPEVDELAAVPLALYAADQGLEKITPNLMGL